MNSEPDRAGPAGPWARYIPLAVTVLGVIVLLLIPFKILSHGYLPPDDALRHAAKAVSGRAWADVLVLRPGITIDFNHGWHQVLAAVHRTAGLGAGGLVAFAVVSLLLLFLGSGFPWVRVETWVATLLLVHLLLPDEFITRLALGRPFVLTMAALITVLGLWTGGALRDRAVLRAGLSALLVALSVWVHGRWYLWGLVPLAFFLARRWRDGLWLGAACALGTLLGAGLTGQPVAFILQQLNDLQNIFGAPVAPRLLVTEFRPFAGAAPVAGAILLLLAWRNLKQEPLRPVFADPVFMLAGLGWALGFAVSRFWLDWGFPAATLWMARELDRRVVAAVPVQAPRRLALAGFAALTFYVAATGDLNSRWSRNLTFTWLTPDKPGLAEWLPGPGGIVYSDDMQVFYRTFFVQPDAPWRYVLGFEPTLMPADDLEIYRRIQWTLGNPAAFAGWIRKLRPEDRLILMRDIGPGQFPELEWRLFDGDTWIGRPKPPPRGDG